ncbi:hypothetical protein LIER_12201 [Lithospermum erythrorhizon]|uniref:Transposase n=1 Tax=Lithospermum erythrorhizon TaxID=34254 RepID=A0AAV3PSK1_LITER
MICTCKTKRSRGGPQGNKIVSSDARSTNVHVIQDFKAGEIVKSKAELILRAPVQSVKANREFKVTHSDPKRWQRDIKVKAKEFLYGVTKAYTEIDFEKKIHQVRATKKNVYDYLIDVDPKKWALCYFPARRYSIMTTNIAESMNALLKEAREFPILGMLETIKKVIRMVPLSLIVGQTMANSCLNIVSSNLLSTPC